jgi:putative oxidoreductase
LVGAAADAALFRLLLGGNRLGQDPQPGAFSQKFVGWGVPYPHLSAALSGYAERIGGILLMLGLFTRLVSIPLMFNMFVAIVKVKIKEVTGIDDFAEMDEALYMFILFWLMMAGPHQR